MQCCCCEQYAQLKGGEKTTWHYHCLQPECKFLSRSWTSFLRHQLTKHGITFPGRNTYYCPLPKCNRAEVNVSEYARHISCHYFKEYDELDDKLRALIRQELEKCAVYGVKIATDGCKGQRKDKGGVEQNMNQCRAETKRDIICKKKTNYIDRLQMMSQKVQIKMKTSKPALLAKTARKRLYIDKGRQGRQVNSIQNGSDLWRNILRSIPPGRMYYQCVSTKGITTVSYRCCKNAHPRMTKGPDGHVPCIMCQKSFCNYARLKRHYVVGHGRTANTIYECKLCKMVTPHRSEFITHTKRPKHIKKMAFARQRYLNAHQKEKRAKGAKKPNGAWVPVKSVSVSNSAETSGSRLHEGGGDRRHDKSHSRSPRGLTANGRMQDPQLTMKAKVSLRRCPKLDHIAREVKRNPLDGNLYVLDGPTDSDFVYLCKRVNVAGSLRTLYSSFENEGVSEGRSNLSSHMNVVGTGLGADLRVNTQLIARKKSTALQPISSRITVIDMPTKQPGNRVAKKSSSKNNRSSVMLAMKSIDMPTKQPGNRVAKKSSSKNNRSSVMLAMKSIDMPTKQPGNRVAKKSSSKNNRSSVMLAMKSCGKRAGVAAKKSSSKCERGLRGGMLAISSQKASDTAGPGGWLFPSPTNQSGSLANAISNLGIGRMGSDTENKAIAIAPVTSVQNQEGKLLDRPLSGFSHPGSALTEDQPQTANSKDCNNLESAADSTVPQLSPTRTSKWGRSTGLKKSFLRISLGLTSSKLLTGKRGPGLHGKQRGSRGRKRGVGGRTRGSRYVHPRDKGNEDLYPKDKESEDPDPLQKVRRRSRRARQVVSYADCENSDLDFDGYCDIDECNLAKASDNINCSESHCELEKNIFLKPEPEVTRSAAPAAPVSGKMKILEPNTDEVTNALSIKKEILDRANQKELAEVDEQTKKHLSSSQDEMKGDYFAPAALHPLVQQNQVSAPVSQVAPMQLPVPPMSSSMPDIICPAQAPQHYIPPQPLPFATPQQPLNVSQYQVYSLSHQQAMRMYPQQQVPSPMMRHHPVCLQSFCQSPVAGLQKVIGFQSPKCKEKQFTPSLTEHSSSTGNVQVFNIQPDISQPQGQTTVQPMQSLVQLQSTRNPVQVSPHRVILQENPPAATYSASFPSTVIKPENQALPAEMKCYNVFNLQPSYIPPTLLMQQTTTARAPQVISSETATAATSHMHQERSTAQGLQGTGKGRTTQQATVSGPVVIDDDVMVVEELPSMPPQRNTIVNIPENRSSSRQMVCKVVENVSRVGRELEEIRPVSVMWESAQDLGKNVQEEGAFMKATDLSADFIDHTDSTEETEKNAATKAPSAASLIDPTVVTSPNVDVNALDLNSVSIDELWQELIRRNFVMMCVCGQGFKNQALYFLHRPCHNTDEPMKCGSCSFEAPNWFAFVAHIMDHNK